MNEITPHTITLISGYTGTDRKSKEPVNHKEVTFGKRINGRTLFAIDSDPQSNFPTQYGDLLLRASITKFGTLKMPVALAVLLSLDSIDREDLQAAFAVFSANSLKEVSDEYSETEEIDAELDDESMSGMISENQVKLAIGLDKNGLVYDLCTFSRVLTGRDEVEADRQSLTGIKRICFLAGKQITQLSESNGTSILEFPNGLDVSVFDELDMVDIYRIRTASEVWRNSFRTKRAQA